MRVFLTATVLAGVLFTTTATSESPLMPLDEVRAGMRGQGISVFQGTTRAPFDVEILGVLPNIVGPRRSLILARLSGQRLNETGVMQGMSGSPVYIEGRLVGAVSYSLGAFTKEPIAGITPIAEMVDAAGPQAVRPAQARPASAVLRWPPTRDDYVVALREAFARLGPGGMSASIPALDIGGITRGPTATLKPIATPFTVAGFSGDTQSLFSTVLSDLGFAATNAATSAGAHSRTAEADAAGSRAVLLPGDAVGVSLISGDLVLGATGTVTHVDGERVYAFGHPFFNLGPTEFPMTQAYVHTLLPSLFVSAKVAALGDVIGTVQQDRATAIAGTLGRGPDLVPVSITLSSDRGPDRRFRFGIVKDQLFTPLLTFASIVNTLQAYEREFGAATFSVRGKTLVRNHGEIALEDIFTGEAPAVGAAAYVAGPLNLLLKNDRQPVQIEGVDLSIQSFEQPRTARLERVWVDTTRPRPGSPVTLYVMTRTYRGEERTQKLEVPVPVHSRGTVSILVSDGTRLAQAEQRELRLGRETDSVDQMIRVLNRARRNNRIYVKLLAPATGAVVQGETLPALPPSALAVIEGDQSGGNTHPLANTVLGEWQLPAEHAVTGQRTLTLTLETP